MKDGEHSKLKTKVAFGLLALCAILFAVIGYSHYRYKGLTKDLLNTKTELSDTSSQLTSLKEERDYIYNNLLSEQAKNTLFENQIKEIAGTVGNLDKLAKTDEELLQKYSRVYFLNEHYVPEALSEVATEYTFENGQTHKVHTKILPYLEKMIKAAEENATPIRIVSAYRSFDDQTLLKGKYLVTYGSGSNQFSADQGYSEHQLGTTLDFTTLNLGADFTRFGDTQAYQWLLDDAYEYGFVLSYPEDNAYYTFEPWHWRFVGTRLAERLHNENENFYDVDQRLINNYLLTIFD